MTKLYSKHKERDIDIKKLKQMRTVHIEYICLAD